MNNIREAIRQLAQGSRPGASLVCTVDAVDREARTVDCTPLDEGAPLLGVNLQAGQGSAFGVVAFPKVGSYVVVGFVADGAAGVVLLTDEVESLEVVISGDTARITADKDGVRVAVGEDTRAELTKDGVRMTVGDDTAAELTRDGITLNGGSLGGAVKVAELTGRINAIEQDINTLKTVFSGWVSVPQDGGAALKAASAAWAASQIVMTQRSDIENKKVKHG